MSRSLVVVAQDLKKLLSESSPLIEDYTREICPMCTDVCCRQKHGVYREQDGIYLSALNLHAPACDHAKHPEAPCQFLEMTGCSLPRWQRPFKCTWYFCAPLLAAMNNGPQKKARTLSKKLEEMICLYNELRERPEALE